MRAVVVCYESRNRELKQGRKTVSRSGPLDSDCSIYQPRSVLTVPARISKNFRDRTLPCPSTPILPPQDPHPRIYQDHQARHSLFWVSLSETPRPHITQWTHQSNLSSVYRSSSSWTEGLTRACRDTKCLSVNKHTDQSIPPIRLTIISVTSSTRQSNLNVLLHHWYVVVLCEYLIHRWSPPLVPLVALGHSLGHPVRSW